RSDFPSFCVASAAAPGPNGVVPQNVRIVIAGVAVRPCQLENTALDPLRSAGASHTSIETVAQNAADVVEPESDVHASADYRRVLTRAPVKRTLLNATGIE